MANSTPKKDELLHTDLTSHTVYSDPELRRNGQRQMVMSELLKEAPGSAISELLKNKSIYEFRETTTNARVVFIRCRFREMEKILDELGGVDYGTYKLDSEGRSLNGMSFESQDTEGRSFMAVAVRDDLPDYEGIYVIVHECVHTAVKILHHHRISADIGDSKEHSAESLAYLVESLSRFGISSLYPELKYDEVPDVITSAADKMIKDMKNDGKPGTEKTEQRE